MFFSWMQVQADLSTIWLQTTDLTGFSIFKIAPETLIFEHADSFKTFFISQFNVSNFDLLTTVLPSVTDISENTFAIYNYSIPNSRLHYPEPFIASASFMHSDLWFAHILLYQYWLWFFFCFLITFFFMVFIFTLRWCTLRIRPCRETRGVSRSKCGDLITAGVPVSWAASIIINESTDAIDYFDGFGTTEMVVGIRAFQWGWEYYYPRDLNLNYSSRPNYNFFIGHSFKYDSMTRVSANSDILWKFYRNKVGDISSSSLFPFLPFANRYSLTSISNFNFSGLDIMVESDAFARVKKISKLTNLDFLVTNVSQVSPSFFENLPIAFAQSQLQSPMFISHSQLPIQNLIHSTAESVFFWDSRTFDVWFRNVSNLKSEIRLMNSIDSYSNLDRIAPSAINILLPLRGASGYAIQFFETAKMIAADKVPINMLKIASGNVSSHQSWDNIRIQRFATFDSLSINFLKFMRTGLNFNQLPNPISSNTALFRNNPFETDKYEILPFFFKNSSEIMPDVWNTSYWTSFNYLVPMSLRIRNAVLFLNRIPTFAAHSHNRFFNYDFANAQYAIALDNIFWKLSDVGDVDNEYARPKKFWNEFRRVTSFVKTSIPDNQIRSFRKSHSALITTKKTSDHLRGVLEFYSLDVSALSIHRELILNKFQSVSSVLLNELHLCRNSYSELKFFAKFSQNVTPLSKFLTVESTIALSRLPALAYARAFQVNFAELEFLTSEDMRKSFDANMPNLFNRNKWIEAQTWLTETRFSFRINTIFNVKNLITNFNALVKVAKPRFDEMRSHAKIEDFSALSIKLPLLQFPKPAFEQLISKNSHSNFAVVLLRTAPINVLQKNNLLKSSYPVFDFPFWLGLKSDSGHHVWIDWFAKWALLEILPSSTSKYAVFGMPFFNKIADFGSTEQRFYNEAENYFLRISKARKLFLPNNLNMPVSLYFFAQSENFLNAKALSHVKSDVFVSQIILFLKITTDCQNFVNENLKIGLAKEFMNSLFLPHLAFVTTTNSSETYSMLLHLLTIRDVLFRFLEKTRNDSVFEISSIVNFETRNLKYDLLSLISRKLNCSETVSPVSLFFRNYCSETSSRKSIFLLHCDQYRSMRKGISNLVRLHATGAVALPIELRIQILASSKDVIHSWAIPSAGIKIDCVPGYSSHKVFLFLVPGIFWGQCMEVCGRYHHWMPIVIYFMKRDLFILWCTHFVLINKIDNTPLSLLFQNKARNLPISRPFSVWIDSASK